MWGNLHIGSAFLAMILFLGPARPVFSASAVDVKLVARKHVVKVIREDGRAEKLEKENPIYRKDVVQTLARAFATLKLNEKNIVVVPADSEAKIVELLASKSLIELRIGGLLLTVSQQFLEGFTVLTKGGQATAREPACFGLTTKPDGTTVVEVYRGSVVVQTNGEEREVLAGSRISMRPGKPLSQPAPFSPSDTADLSQSPPSFDFVDPALLDRADPRIFSRF